MTDLDDLDLFTPTTESTVNVTTKRCARHEWMQGGTTFALHCARCGKVRDESVVRRNRNNASRGKRIQRERIVGLGGQNLPGNKPNHDGIGLLFGYESKSGGAFSERLWRWLRGIPVKGDQTAVLIITDTPGPGHRARSYVVVEYDQWRALHGEERS